MNNHPIVDTATPTLGARNPADQRPTNLRRGHVSPKLRVTVVAATAGLVLAGLLTAIPLSQAPAQSISAIKIDGVDELANDRTMAPDFDRVLRNANTAQYIVINPANGPEAIDGGDPGGSGYAPPNPNVEDFVLRAKRLVGNPGRVLGWLPAGVGAGRATDYRDGYGTDGVMLADYDCASAATATTAIKTSWPAAVVVTATAGCTGGINPASIVGPANLGAGSQDPYAGYPASAAPKLGIPAYFTDLASWDRLLVGIGDVGAVVVDWSAVGAIRTKIQAARAGGAKVYAYVPTGYITQTAGLANASNAGARITAALADPDINGVFLDEVRSGYSTLARNYYGAFYNQAVALGKELIYNPGQTAGGGFLNISSKTINYEGRFATYAGWPAGEWARTIPSDRIWQVIHTTDSADIVTAANLARSRNAGLIWIAPNDQFTSFPDAAYYAAVRTAVRTAVATSGAPVGSSSGAGSSGAGSSSGASSGGGGAAASAGPAPLIFPAIVDAATTTTAAATTTTTPAVVAAPVVAATSTASANPAVTTTTTPAEAPPATKPLPIISTTTAPAAAPAVAEAAPILPIISKTASPKTATQKARYRLVRSRSCRNVKVRLRSGRIVTRTRCKTVSRRVLIRAKK